MNDLFTRSEFLKAVPAGLGFGSALRSQRPNLEQSAAESKSPARSPARKGSLLFFFADEKGPATGAVVPVLGWLAHKAGVDFEAYICIRPKTWAGRILAFNGNGHREQFYYAANFYQKVLYCSLTESPALQFKREVMAFGGDIVSTRKPHELVDFYLDVFSYFDTRLPGDLVLLPSRPSAEDRLWIQPYCYPDVCFPRALAVTDDCAEEAFKRLKEAGARRVALLYCSDRAAELARQARLSVDTIDLVQPDDNYGAITSRIADRWIKRAKGVAFADPSCILKWQAYYVREGLITLYEPADWRPFAKTVRRYAGQTGNNLIHGNQVVDRMNDAVIAELSKEGLVMSLAGPDARIGITVQSRKPLPVDWLRNAHAPWEEEYTDAFLLEQAHKGGIPVCFLLYASDLGHLPTLPRVLDLMLVEGMKCGLAFPSTWYEFEPQSVEQLYIPVDVGGVYPNVEPLIVSAGIGAATEAEGYLQASLLATALGEAKRRIASYVGQRLVPIGYYSFTDACPMGKHQSGQPPFQTFEEAGFDYAISYKDETENARIVYQSGKFTVLNQQNLHWYQGRKFVLGELQDWEKRMDVDGLHGWIIFGIDTPFYGLAPGYIRELKSVHDAMSYAATGGDRKRLFLAKPHEVVRYARILQQTGKL